MNSAYYLSLAALSLSALIYAHGKRKGRPVLLLFLAMIGLGYIIEAVIYVFLDSYQYIPKLLKYDPYFDSNLGAMTSNTLALPVAATFLCAFGFRWLGRALCTAFFIGVEFFFVKLGIYKHHWWRLEYTAFGLPFYFMTAEWLYRQMTGSGKGWVRVVNLFLILNAVLGTVHILPIMLFHARSFTPGWFENDARDTTAFAFIYHTSESLICVGLVYWRRIALWAKGLFMLALAAIATVVLDGASLVHIRAWWDPVYYLLLPVLGIMWGNVIRGKLELGMDRK